MPDMPLPPEPSHPDGRSDARRDTALELALRAVVPGPWPTDRPDNPAGLITAIRRLPEQDAQYEDFPAGIDPRLRAALASRGIERLYTHQARAIEHALAGRNVG